MNSKYAIPQVSGVITRERLIRLLEKQERKNVFIVLGQAAQGKSTLIASFLNGLRDSSIWLNLEQKESSYKDLFYLLSDAVSRNIKMVENPEKISLPQLTFGTMENISRYTLALNALFRKIDRNFNLVIDDLDGLDENASSFVMLQNLIREVPGNIRLFLISRKMPPLGIQKLKLENKVFVINNRELAFTLDETALFFKHKIQGEIDQENIKKIHSITEGWVGGVVLVSETIRRKPDMAWLSESLTGEVAGYFAKEVYELLPDHIKEFLLKVCFFDEIDSETAVKFTDNKNSGKILNDLEKRNLFIQRVESPSKGSFFRLHKLFKTFLAAALKKAKSKAELRRLYLEAAEIFKEKGELENSIQYFLKGENFKAAGAMIKKIGTDLVIKGRFGVLEEWITLLPELLVWEDPWLVYYLTMTRRIKGGNRNINDFKIAFDLFSEKKDLRGAMLSAAFLIETAVFIRKPPAYIAQWMKTGEDLLISLKDKSLYTWARAVLWQQIGFGHIAGEGELAKGISACQNAVILGTKIGNVDIQLDASIVMILGYIYSGNFYQAEQRIKGIRNLTQEGIHPEYRALKKLVDIDLAIKKGEFEAAESFLDTSEKDIEAFGLIFLYPGFVEAKAMHRLYTGKHEQALQLANHLSDFSILSGNQFYQGISHRLKAVIFYHTEEFTKARQEALKSIAFFNRKQANDTHYFMAKLLHGLVLICCNEFETAQKELADALEGFEALSSDLLAAETKAGMGLLCWEQEKGGTAKKYICDAIEKAAKQRYHQFIFIRPRDSIKILLLAASFDSSEMMWEYTASIISSKLSNSVKKEVDLLLEHPFFRKEVQGDEQLKRISKYCMPKIRIESFGEFKVFINKKQIKNSQWNGNKPKLLLKFIVCRNGQDLPKEKLIEDIWPGAPAGSGEKNFKVTLHRLRKTLQGGLKDYGRHSYVKLEAGLVSLDPELVTVDAEGFIVFCEKGDSHYKKGNFHEALFFYEKAEKLYKGDFLEEELYAERICQKRENLKTRYIESLMKKAQIHEELNQNQMAMTTLKKVIEKDPVFEPAYQNLMIVYADSGMVNAALTLFEKCKSSISKELEMLPDRETVRIQRKIKSIQR